MGAERAKEDGPEKKTRRRRHHSFVEKSRRNGGTCAEPVTADETLTRAHYETPRDRHPANRTAYQAPKGTHPPKGTGTGAMMDPDDNGSEELEAVPSDMFDSSPSPVSSGLGWAGAAAAGTALFAVRARAHGSTSLASCFLPPPFNRQRAFQQEVLKRARCAGRRGHKCHLTCLCYEEPRNFVICNLRRQMRNNFAVPYSKGLGTAGHARNAA